MNFRASVLFSVGLAAAVAIPARAQIQEVPFTHVRLGDAFWAPRIEVNRTVSIPSALRECEKNGRFDNFALAAANNGNMSTTVTEHRGDFSFDDTDPRNTPKTTSPFSSKTRLWVMPCAPDTSSVA